jgi:hypothetical protein
MKYYRRLCRGLLAGNARRRNTVPIDYRRDDARRRIIVAISGPALYDEIAYIVERQAAEGTWSYTMLYDERDATSTLTRAETGRLLVLIGQLRAVHGRRGRVALVFDADARHGPGRAFSTLGDIMGLDTAVFNDPARAEAWLDVGR